MKLIHIKSTITPKNYSAVREILKKERGEKLAPFIYKLRKLDSLEEYLSKENINYEIYQSIEINQRESVFASYGEVISDKEREKEAQELENAEEEDIINEECKKFDKVYPFEILIDFQGKKGKALPDQIKTYSHSRIIKRLGILDPKYYSVIEKKLKEVFG
ncbi:32561_t:CDS:2 [Gigaspora margarita]|uniref:32561_t:CDS:1 n=1 Tax=Gigaspora margarita TaxID=4874 RepID=A0ABM8VWL1_GIGMA|nr:32561_t:CDS:2 [Gigaspora margarita]